MNFKKLQFKENSGDWFAETYHNILMIFKRKMVVANEETLITSFKDSDTFVLSCFGSVYEFETFEECEEKANKENQDYLQRKLDEMLQYIELPISRISWEKIKNLKDEDLENFGKKYELKAVEK